MYASAKGKAIYQEDARQFIIEACMIISESTFEC